MVVVVGFATRVQQQLNWICQRIKAKNIDKSSNTARQPVRPNSSRGFEVDASKTRLAKSAIESAMTISDNRRCPVQGNTSRQKPERCSDETYHYRRPPARAGPAALGQFVLEPFLHNSHLSRDEMRRKCVVINTTRPETQPQSNRTPPPPDTSQPASQPSDVFKGVCTCEFKGEGWGLHVPFCPWGQGCVVNKAVGELPSSSFTSSKEQEWSLCVLFMIN